MKAVNDWFEVGYRAPLAYLAIAALAAVFALAGIPTFDRWFFAQAFAIFAALGAGLTWWKRRSPSTKVR